MKFAWWRWTALLFVVGLVTSTRPGHAQQTNATPTPPPSTAPASPVQDSSWIAQQFPNEAPSYSGNLAGIAKKTVRLSGGRTVEVGELTRNIFKDQQIFEAELGKAPAGALFGRVQIEEKAYEFTHAYVVMRKVSAVVADPGAVRRVSPVYSRIFPSESVAGTLKDLEPESQQGFFAAKTKLLANESNGHPLQVAAQQSDQALLDAVYQGKGPISIRDSFMILKVATVVNPQGQVMGPKANNGVHRLDTRMPLSNSFVRSPLSQLSLPPHQTVGGAVSINARFLNGFTEAHDWFWERRWEFWSGHAHLQAGLYYGFGIRIPIEVSGKITPSTFENSGGRDSSSRFRAEVSLKTLDADRQFYTDAGLGDPERRNGEEFLLYAGFGYGYSFRALWITLANQPYKTHELDFSQHFKPPFGGQWEPLKEFFIPASVTRTQFSFTGVSGNAEVGARLEGRGTIDARLRLVHDGQPFTSFSQQGGGQALDQSLRFTSPGQTLAFEGSLPVYNTPQSKTYGFFFDKMSYKSDFSLLPGIRYSVKVGYKRLSHTFSDTLWFESLRVPLPSLTLGSHSGTRDELRFEGGRKTYRGN